MDLCWQSNVSAYLHLIILGFYLVPLFVICSSVDSFCKICFYLHLFYKFHLSIIELFFYRSPMQTRNAFLSSHQSRGLHGYICYGRQTMWMIWKVWLVHGSVGCQALPCLEEARNSGQDQFLTQFSVSSRFFKTNVAQLVGEAGSWGSWLRSPRCSRVCVGILVFRAHYQATVGSWQGRLQNCSCPGKVFILWWMERDQGILQTMPAY